MSQQWMDANYLMDLVGMDCLGMENILENKYTD